MAATVTAGRPRAVIEGSGLQVLERAFAILSLFTPERPEWTMTEIARECGLPIPTTHRILGTLRAYGYVSRDDSTKRFRLGLAAVELGERARSVAGLRTVALPVLRRLSMVTGETALLTVLNESRDRSVCLERVESSQPLRLSVEPGRQLPLHAGASQKVLLAFMTEDEVASVLRLPLERMWHETITSPTMLLEELASIRRKGFAGSYEETNPGVWGLAVPLLDSSGQIVAGIGLAGPSARVLKRNLTDHLDQLLGAAAEIRGLMGLQPPPARSRAADGS